MSSITTNTIINETELSLIADLAMTRYNELLTVNFDKLLAAVTHDHKENLAETKLILETLTNNTGDFQKRVRLAVTKIMISTIKELPRTVLISQIAENMHGMASTSRFRVAAVIIKLLELSGLCSFYSKINSHGFNESITILTYKLTQITLDELAFKTRNLPKNTIPSATVKYAGHFKKETTGNDHMLSLLTKLNSVGYTLDSRVWNKFKYQLAAYRFDDMKTQEAMITEGDKLIGTTFYFNHRFGIDNGRIYCDGDLFTLQGGALNYAYKFADKRMLTAKGMKALHDKVDELMAEESLSFKEQVELYSLSMDLIDAQNGLPVGTIIHIDAKLSGLQHQSIATRDAKGAHYCGLLTDLSDGYSHLKSKLSNGSSLTRQMVKDAFNPYQYGAGKDSTIAPVLEAGAKLDYVEWEKAYQAAFPKAYELRAFLLSMCKSYKSDTYSYTTPSGFNAVITGLGTVETAITTVYGKLHYSRQEISQDFMGVKLVAAFSHMLDSSALHYIVGKAAFDMHVIHDSFGSHPNDVDRVHALYVEAMQEHLCSNVLENFISDIVASVGSDTGIVRVNVNRLIANTLTPSMIVGGLY